jgi:hypothetical protein
LATGVRVQDSDPPPEIKSCHLDGTLQVAIVADHKGRIKGTAVREISEVDGKTHVRALLARLFHLDGAPGELRGPGHRRSAP